MTIDMRRIAGLALATLVLHLVLALPNHPAAMTFGALFVFPLELPAILLLLLALPATGAVTASIRTMLSAFLVAMVLVKGLDFAMFSALGRAFNPVSDLPLVLSGWQLATGAIGVALAGGAVAGAILLLALTGGIVWWATGIWARTEPRLPVRRVAAVGAVMVAGFAIVEIGHTMRGWPLPFKPPGAAFTTRVAVERVLTYRATLADFARFDAAASVDPFETSEGLFDLLQGRDVEIVFVESYGRASFDNPLYAPTHERTLRAAEGRIAQAGLAMRSAWLTAPIAGGQSWLAHATIASGLRIDSQTRYAALLGSSRKSLYHLASEAGYRTAAVMPAITMPWPEATALGFEAVLAAADLGYRGEAFNWVTMPDQFTLAHYDDLLGRDGRPRFIQTALISSHAPWVPVPEMVGWDEVGDGTIFNRWATSGDTPEVVWRDPDRIRDQYRQAVDYALQTVMSHAARRGADAALMVILGDHPPAGFVSQIDSGDVAIHIVGPPEVVGLISGWGFDEGLVPGQAAPVWPMEDFRDRFVDAFTTPPGPSLSHRQPEGVAGTRARPTIEKQRDQKP